MSLTISDQLHAVRDLIKDEARWCTGWFAFDKDGGEVDPSEKTAICWCFVGACMRVGAPGLKRKLDVKAREMFDAHMIAVNDTLGHAAVLQVIDAAIAEAEFQSC